MGEISRVLRRCLCFVGFVPCVFEKEKKELYDRRGVEEDGKGKKEII